MAVVKSQLLVLRGAIFVFYSLFTYWFT